MAAARGAKVGTIMVDCNDLDVMVEFWGEVLGLEAKARYPSFVWMSRLSEGGPALAFQLVPEPKTTKNRVHLDVSSDDREALVAYVEKLGGSRIADHEVAGFHWTVAADPEGNEFCITDAH
jgi:catechol 2,3-dioxygenase-like lactoylglutathione lyase family enzyme